MTTWGTDYQGKPCPSGSPCEVAPGLWQYPPSSAEQVTSTVGQAVGNATGLSAATDAAAGVGNAVGNTLAAGASAAGFFGALSQQHTWMRVVQVVGGMVAVVLGAWLIEQDVTKSIVGAGKAAAAGAAAKAGAALL